MKKNLYYILSLFAFFCIGINTQAAIVDGQTYTVGSGGDYSTLAAAIIDLNNSSITTGVTFKLLGNQVLPAAQFISKPVTITNNGNNTPQITLGSGVTGRHFTIYSGANLVTFQNIVILGPNATYSGGVVAPISSPIGVGGGIEAIASVTLANCVVAGCCIADASGGAIRSTTSTSVITINNTDISYNRAGYNNGWVSHSDLGTDQSNSGGGITVAGPLTLAGVINIVGNMAADNGGGIWKSNVGAFTTTGLTAIKIDNNTAVKGFGGGMYTQAAVSLSNATITNNISADRGGGIMDDLTGNLTLNGATISGNKAGYDIITAAFLPDSFSGGGIYAYNSLTLSGSIILENNSSANEGGGIWKSSVAGSSFITSGLTSLVVNNNTTQSGSGGGIYSGVNLDLSGVTTIQITNNKAGTSSGDGGGICAMTNLTLPSATITGNSCGNNGGGINVGSSSAGGTLILKGNVTFRSNTAVKDGGAMRTMAVSTSELSSLLVDQNTAGAYGGGIANYGSMDLSNVSTVTISGNTSGSDGGGIRSGNSVTLTLGAATVTGNTATGAGGGIYSGTANLTGTLIEHNKAASGGGMYIYGTASAPNTSTITNVNINNNQATTNNGGGLYNTALLTLSGSTIADNAALGNGGGFYTGTSAATLINTTVSNNKAGYNATTENWGTSGDGGGIYAGNSLILQGTSKVINNTAVGEGGGIYKNATGSLTSNSASSFEISGNVSRTNNGGGIRSSAPIDFSAAAAVTIINNTAKSNGGGIYTTNSAITLGKAAISDNRAGYDMTANSETGSWTTSGSGGGIYAGGALSLKDLLTMDGNAAGNQGGAIYKSATDNFTAQDGASLEITNNVARNSHGGGMHLDGTTDLSQAASVVIDNNTAYSDGGGINASAALTLKNVIITNNKAGYDVVNNTWRTSGNGGGICTAHTLTLKESVQFENNGAGANGGAIYKEATGNFDLSSLTAFTVQNNTAKSSHGGGIYTAAPLALSNKNGVTLTLNSAGADGGGIYASAALQIDSLYIPKNTAVNGGGAIYAVADLHSNANTFFQNNANNGGGIYLNNTATITNTTFSTNTATGSGGGLYANNSVHNITFSTFNGNTPSAIYFDAVAGQTLNGNIVYGNGSSEMNLIPSGSYNIFKGTTRSVDANNNITLPAGKADSIFAVANNTTDLATLADNGGSTLTYNIKRNGFAYNFIPTTVAWTIATDQRGIARPNTTCKFDAGAVELQATDDVPAFAIKDSDLLTICNGFSLDLSTLYTTINVKDTAYYWDAARTQEITSMPVTITESNSTIYIRFTTTSNCDYDQQLDFTVTEECVFALLCGADVAESCQNKKGHLNVYIKDATAPYTIVINDGVNDIIYEDVATDNNGFATIEITFNTAGNITYTLESVTDSNNHEIPIKSGTCPDQH